MRGRGLAALSLCACLVLALAVPVFANGELTWDGGPPIIVDSEREYNSMEAILERPNFPAIELGEDEDFTAVLCGEILTASARMLARSDHEPDYEPFGDFSGGTWSWYPIELANDYADYLSEWCEWTPISGYTSEAGFAHFWAADVRLTEPGYTCLRVDTRQAVYGEHELIAALHALAFCGSLEVYGFGGTDPSPVQAGTAASLDLFFREPIKNGGSKNVSVSSVPALSDCEFAYTLESAVRPDGTAFTEDELAAAAEGLDTSSSPATFTAAEPGTYSWRVDAANRPGAYPATITIVATPPALSDAEITVAAPSDPAAGMTVADFKAQNADAARILGADGAVADDALVCTGMTLVTADNLSTTIVVPGDVIGSGRIAINQLVRLANALSVSPLDGARLNAGDLNHNGKLDITDLTILAGMLRPASPEPGAAVSLTIEQTRALSRNVAAPLLLTEWNAVMDYPERYDPEAWKNQAHSSIDALDSRLTAGTVDRGNPFWIEYLYCLRDQDRLPWDGTSDRTGAIFGEGSSLYPADMPMEWRVTSGALRDYFHDAFGTDVPSSVKRFDGFQSDGALSIFMSDPAAFLEMDVPGAAAETVDGKITFTGGSWGMFGPWGTQLGEDTLIPWAITLDVEPSEESPYGCIVTGYQATALDLP